jgi:hypothetical protein
MGHTEKQTLTHYRARLLSLLPAQAKDFGNPDRRQFNDMIRYGWVETRGGGCMFLTPEGLRLVNEKNKREGFALLVDGPKLRARMD